MATSVRATRGRRSSTARTKGSAYLAQTTCTALSNGVTQVYWYGWDDYGLGIWPTSKPGRVLKPGVTYNNLNRWLSGAKNGTPIGSISTCTIKRKKTKQFFAFRSSVKRRRTPFRRNGRCARPVTFSTPASRSARAVWKVGPRRCC